MTTQGRARRGDTRQRIQDVALELFAEQGYEKTSLREIADRIEVTKAALYYHFRTKEDILVGIVEDIGRPAQELVEWAQGQPRTLETKLELLRRYGEAMEGAAPLFRFLHENQASVRDLNVGERFKERVLELVDLLVDPGAGPADRLRCGMAVFAMHGSIFMLRQMEATPEEKRAAALEVATELVTRTVRE